MDLAGGQSFADKLNGIAHRDSHDHLDRLRKEGSPDNNVRLEFGPGVSYGRHIVSFPPSLSLSVTVGLPLQFFSSVGTGKNRESCNFGMHSCSSGQRIQRTLAARSTV